MRPGFGVEGVAVAVVVHLKKFRDHRVARIFRERECFHTKTARALPSRRAVVAKARVIPMPVPGLGSISKID